SSNSTVSASLVPLPHTIRLRGPWEYEPLTRCFTRRFHRPTSLTATSRVWLVVTTADSPVRVNLNSQILGEITPLFPARFDITPHLGPQNLISIMVARPGEFAGQVSLEIEEAAV